MLILAAGTCVVALLLLVDLVLGGRQLHYLRDCQEADSGPRVSVIIAASDEAAGIEYALAAYGGGSRPWLALFYPLAATILAYIVASATTRTALRGGIEWRSTFYPLSALRQNVV